jgi:hypothetical protein
MRNGWRVWRAPVRGSFVPPANLARVASDRPPTAAPGRSEARIARFDAHLLAKLERNVLPLLQTIPGIDLIAIAHQILGTLFFMLQGRGHFRDSAVDHEALSVQRNAPRWIKALSKFGFLTPANA